jgi:uncharacterized protein
VKTRENTYQIAFQNLDNGSYDFHFQVDKLLFVQFENEEIHDADLSVSCSLERKFDDFLMKLHAKGSLDLQCDRCLDLYSQEISLNHEINIRLDSETNYDLEENYVTISRESDYIDVSYFIYEMVILGLPIRRVHPEDENGNSLCNPDVIKYIAGESIEIDEKETDISDNHWKETLKTFINN